MRINHASMYSNAVCYESNFFNTGTLMVRGFINVTFYIILEFILERSFNRVLLLCYGEANSYRFAPCNLLFRYFGNII